MRTFFLFMAFFSGISPAFSNEVLYYWSGGITDSSVTVNAVLQQSSERIRLAVSTKPDMQSPVFSGYVPCVYEKGFSVSMTVSGLRPNTVYYYAIEADGSLDSSAEDVGTFRTFDNGPFSYAFAVGSCAFMPNNRVYEEMKKMNPLFYLNTGDLHYADPGSADVKPHRDAYETRVMMYPREAAFFQCTPFAYMWDDHDFCGNNATGSGGCGKAAKQAYREYIPHYPIAAPDSSNAVYQSFTAGRVRFIMSDMRAERNGTDMISNAQLEWIRREALAAKESGQVIAWISSVSFTGSGGDNWGAYPRQRKELSDFFRENAIENMFIISGDAHMLAIDNGSNGDFSSGNNPYKYPVFQAAALNNVGSDKGGTYSEGGTFPNPLFTSQWGIVTVNDDGGDIICIRLQGYRMNMLGNVRTNLLDYEFCREVRVSVADSVRQGEQWQLQHPLPGEEISVTVRNYLGGIMLETTAAEDAKQIAVDTRKLEKGTYFIRIKNDRTSRNKKLMIY